MQQFSRVLQELRKWFETFKVYPILHAFELQLLFGALGVMALRELLYELLPVRSYSTLNTLFFTIPLSSLAYVAFLVGVWLTLVSKNVKYTPYALWIYVLIVLFPFTSLSLSSLITPAVYTYLGYALFKYMASPYSEK